MCDIQLYYELYNSHAGYPGPHHAWYVRQARALITVHRRTCPECREDGMRSNYNLRAGKLTHRASKGG